MADYVPNVISSNIAGLDPNPNPSHLLSPTLQLSPLFSTASNKKLGGGLGMRLKLISWERGLLAVFWIGS